MKKIFLLLIIISLFGHTSAQFNNNNAAGTAQTMWGQVGGIFGGYGVQIKNYFADTSAANASSIGGTTGFLKNIPGIIIRTADDSYWARSRDLQKWNKINAGTGTIPTWQQTLDATNGKILTSNNSIQSNGSYVFEMFNNERAAIRFDNTTTITSLGDVDATVYGNKLAIHDNDSKAYFINTDSTSAVSAIKLGVNTSIPDSTLHVVGGIFGTRGLRLSSLTNLSTQNRLLGQFGTDGDVGYITLGSGLSLAAGVLSNSGVVSTPTWQDSLFFNQSTLSQFNIKFAQVAHGFANSKCHIVLGPGDSNTDRPEVFNLRLRGLLENYGKVDPGWCGFNPNQYPTYGIIREVTAGWTKNDLATPGMSLNIDDIVSNDNTQYVQFETTTFGTTFDSLTIYFYKTASSGSFSVQVDAGTPDTVSTTGADVAGKYSLTGMSNAAHTITIRPVADGAVRMLGAYAYSSDASFVISKVAHSGASSINFADAPVTWDYIFQDMHPDLAILNIGTNDMTYDSTSADYLINLETIIDRIRTNNEFISIAILAPSDNGLTTVEPKINYIESAFSAANNKSVALGSLYKFWGDYDNALNNSVFFDQIHFNYTFAGDGNIKLIGSLLAINTQTDSTIFATVTTLADTASALRALISGVAIGSTVTSATAGSIFYAGTGGKLQQSNSKLYYDSTNVRLGLGISSPTYDFQLEKTVNGSVGLAIVNQSGGTSGAARIDVARSFGGDYYGSLYYAGDGNTIYTPITFNILASASTTAMNLNHTGAGAINFLTNNTQRAAVSPAGNFLIGGTSDPASAVSSIGIFNGTIPTGSITNGTILYSEDVAASSELKVRDEAGNITVLSPHNFSKLGKPSEELAWSFHSEKDGKYISVDMALAIRTIEELTKRVSLLENKLKVKTSRAVKLIKKGNL